MNVVSETRHLRLLVALDDEGSLHAAARRLHLTPSALSQQLRELEDRLGGRLFRRQWRRLSATPAGRRFIQGARGVLVELDRLEGETRQLLAGSTGTLRVAAACQQSYRWLPGILARFAALEPGVEVGLVAAGAGEDLIEELVARRLDAALVAGGLTPHPRVKATPLFRDELVALVGRRHPWFGRHRVEAAAFGAEHLLTDGGALDRSAPLGRALFEAGEVAPRKVTLLPMTGSVAIDLARANLGVTVMPRWAVAPVLGSGLAAVRVGRGGLWLDWAVATRDEPPDRALHSFVETLRAFHPLARRAKRAEASGPGGA